MNDRSNSSLAESPERGKFGRSLPSRHIQESTYQPQSPAQPLKRMRRSRGANSPPAAVRKVATWPIRARIGDLGTLCAVVERQGILTAGPFSDDLHGRGVREIRVRVEPTSASRLRRGADQSGGMFRDRQQRTPEENRRVQDRRGGRSPLSRIAGG